MRRRTATPLRSGGFALARAIALAGSIVAGVIVAGIVLVVLDANPRNDIVEAVTDAARWLAGPFRGLFSIESDEWRTVVNWGLAAVVYLALSRVIARLLTR
jgi:hypothetical protein